MVANQTTSDKSGIKNSDLQVGKATGSSPSFSMAHKMGLAIISMTTQSPNKRYYLQNNSNFNWIETTETITITSSDSYTSTAKPYKSGSTHYYISKKDETTSFATSSTETGIGTSSESVNNSWNESVSISEGTAQTITPTFSMFAYSQQWNLEVGDVLFSDRSLSRRRNKNTTATTIFDAKVAAGLTPVGIVFATSSTVTMPTYDQQKSQNGIGNFTHGYAMALKCAVNADGSGGVKWSASDNTVANSSGTRTMTSANYTAIVSDMNGLKYSKTIRAKYTSDANCLTYHPAVGKAITYSFSGQTTTFSQQTSGWYLPSAGQMYQWLKAFGNSTALSATPTINSNGYYCSWPNCATIASNVNTYLANALGNSSYYHAYSDQQWIWTVSEHSASYAWEIAFDNVLYIYGYQKQQQRRVRSVIAF